MSPQALKQKEQMLNNKETIKPRMCKYSSTGWCICKTVLECAILDCSEGACIPWEGI